MTESGARLRVELREGTSTQSEISLVPAQPVSPFSIGTQGAWKIQASGVAPVHGYMYFDGRAVYVSSVEGGAAVWLNGTAVGARWEAAKVGSEIVLGSARLRVEADDWGDDATETKVRDVGELIDQEMLELSAELIEYGAETAVVEYGAETALVEQDRLRELLRGEGVAQADDDEATNFLVLPERPGVHAEQTTAPLAQVYPGLAKPLAHASVPDAVPAALPKPGGFAPPGVSAPMAAPSFGPIVPQANPASVPAPAISVQPKRQLMIRQSARENPTGDEAPTKFHPLEELRAGMATPVAPLPAEPSAQAALPPFSPAQQAMQQWPPPAANPFAPAGQPFGAPRPPAPTNPALSGQGESKFKESLEKLKTQWKAASLPQRLIAVLMPFTAIAMLFLFDDPEEAVEPAPAVSVSHKKQAPPPASTNKPPVVVVAPPPSTASSEAADAGDGRRVDAGTKSVQRDAIDAVAAGDRKKAIEKYRELVAQHPQDPAYREALRILEAGASGAP